MIPLFTVNMAPSALSAISDTLYSGYLTEGPRVKEFEKALEEWTGAPTLAVNSCTSAITLALKAFGVRRGDEVITTPMTCSATNLPILHLGATPVWADIDPRTGLIDLEDAHRKQTHRTAVTIGIDWGGARCDLEGFSDGIPTLVDAAHAMGSPSRAVATCYSFQAIKHMTTGDGGAVAIEADGAFERAKRLRWFGIDRDAPCEGDNRIDLDIREPGYKFHMNDLTASLGLAQLSSLPVILNHHQTIGQYYDFNLDERFGKPPSAGSRWLYTLLLPKAGQQEIFRRYMAEKGIQVSQVHRRNDSYTVFKRAVGDEYHLPGVDEFSSRMMCIPIHSKVTWEDAKKVVEACNEWMTK